MDTGHRRSGRPGNLLAMLSALRIAFLLSLCGSVFSGVLSYRELFGATAVACPAPGAPGTILGYPACVYGFVMFLVLTFVTGLGLRAAGAQVAPRRAFG